MVKYERIVDTILIFFVYVCELKVEDYVIFLCEGSICTRYECILRVCRGLCKHTSRDNESFKFFHIFQPMNVMI